MNNKIQALVVGARGAFGGAVLSELLRRDAFEVRALVRPGGAELAPGVKVVTGDATNEADLMRATEGVDMIVYGLNFPYQEWEKKLLPAMHTLAKVAAKRAVRIVFPGNVYGLDPEQSGAHDESSPRRAVGKKGELRNQAEEILVQACERGAKLTVVRAGDFFGPGAPNSWFHFMTKGAKEDGAPLALPEARKINHAWAYLPDLAQTIADLMGRQEKLGDCEFFHFKGHEVSAPQMLSEVRAALGRPEHKVRRMPWFVLRVLGLFVPLLREIVAMRYLWQKELLLDDGKLRATLLEVPHTPLDVAVATSLGVQPASTRGPRAARSAYSLQTASMVFG